ncbi:MAG: lipid kinase [Bacteroidaceae bacterium]|nr:lipid kinase [Bacteroidaceae bacterium]
MEKERIGIIFSPRVGSRKANKHWYDIQAYLTKKNVIYDFVQSEGSGSVERLTKMLCANGYHTIVLVGNDTSLNEAVNAVINYDRLPEDFAFGLIPNGPNNSFAHFWGATQDEYKRSVDTMIRRQVKKIDVGFLVYTGDDGIPYRRYFLNCINIGLGAKVADIMERYNLLTGSKALAMIPAAITNLINQKVLNIRMSADREDIDENVMSVCIGNCTGYGQTPNAIPYNGLLDMTLIYRPKFWHMAKAFWLLERGKFLNYRHVRPYRIREIEIEDISKAKVSIDGTLLDTKHPAPMRVGLEPESFNFIV